MITPELITIIEEAIRSDRLDLHVALPCRVESVDWTKKTVTVQVELKTLLPEDGGTFIEETIAPIQNVPIGFGRTKKFICSLPIEVGDTGELLFNEGHIGQWRATGQITVPDDKGRHGLSGAVFIPILSTDADNKDIPSNISGAAVFGKLGGAQIRAKGTTVEVTSNDGASAADFVALSAKVDKYIELIDGVLTNWTPVPQDGGAALKTAYTAQRLIAYPPTFAPTPTASTNLKAD